MVKKAAAQEEIGLKTLKSVSKSSGMISDKNENRTIILEVLKTAPLTSSELRTRLFTRSIRIPEYEVLKDLRRLQNDGLVYFDLGRWHTRNAAKSVIKPPFVSPRIITQQATFASAPRALTQWSPSQSQIIADTIPSKNSEEPQKENFKQQNFSGPWGSFRKLLGYYTDCVRNDEGCEASGYLQDQGKRFIYLRQFGSWYPKAGKPWTIKIPISNALQGFSRNLSILGESGVLVLGYPLQIWSKAEVEGLEGAFVKPVFTYQLSAVPEGDCFLVSCDDPWPEVNLDWLTYALKQADHQRAFLNLCGLMDRGQADESLGDGSRLAEAPDLKILAAGVTAFFGERIREPLRPESLSSLDLTDKPVSGIYNRAVLMVGNRTRYARSLLKELNQIASFGDEQLDQTALRFIFKTQHETPTSIKINAEVSENSVESTNEGTVLEVSALNGEQRQCIASLLHKNITVVTGPPGTGKSQVVAATMLNARIKNQTVLFSSRNHKAIDAVVTRLVLEDQRPLVIRANSKEDSFLKFGFEAAIKQLLGEEYNEKARERWVGVHAKLSELLSRRGKYGLQSEEIQELRDSLGQIEQQIEELSEKWSLEMLFELSQNETRFPAKHVQVLEKQIGAYRLKNRPNFWDHIDGWVKSYQLRPRTEALHIFLKKYCLHWPGIPKYSGFAGLRELALKLPVFISASKFCGLKIEMRPIEDRLRELPKIEEIVLEVKKISDELEEMMHTILKLEADRRTGLPPDADRETLAALRSALRGLDQPVSDEEDRKAIRTALENHSPFLLKHFPLWAVTNLAIGSRFPLVPGLFDLAIIDEASQCDIASAIPIFFRAKRVGVVGDPQQLSHVTKIKGTRDALLRKRHDITQMNNEQRFSYPDTSLYDLFAQTNGVYPVMLKETYRSVAEIAEYSNRSFYGGTLRVMTAADRLRVPRHMKPGIHWTEVVSDIRSMGPHGCVATEEVRMIVELLKKLLIENSFEGTVGVVTPFVQQKLRINDAIVGEIPIGIRRNAQLLIDTAHGFQGDERDVMLLSLCAGPSMPMGSLGFIRQTANLMNVAVSRARAVLHVIGNKSWAAESGIPHLVNLAVPAGERPVRKNPFQSRWYPHESPWEKVLYDALKTKGVEAEPQYPILGRRLDLALMGREEKSLKIDIEVDGDRYHRNSDGTRKSDDVWRDIQLQAAGWKVMRFWVYQLREDLEGCVTRILKSWR